MHRPDSEYSAVLLTARGGSLIWIYNRDRYHPKILWLSTRRTCFEELVETMQNEAGHNIFQQDLPWACHRQLLRNSVYMT